MGPVSVESRRGALAATGDAEPRPVGPVVDPAPAPRPGPVSLIGHYGRVEKLAAAHAADLWSGLAGHDGVWTYMPSYGPFAAAPAFTAWVAERAGLADPYSYAVVDPAGRAVGIVALMEIRPVQRVMEVGHIVYAPCLQRTRLGTEAQFLLARYAFETLGCRRYEWKCNSLNAPSCAAALRYGFVQEGVLRQHMIAKGRNRDTTMFSMLDREWPARKAAFERWLDRGNFDADGRQRHSLSELNRPAGPA
jgi:RimJ/RimL family protein N-acetyltransferase